MDIKEFQKEVHENAKAHGWWDKERTPAELLCLIHSEVSEALEEVRSGVDVRKTYYSGKRKARVDSQGFTSQVIHTSDTPKVIDGVDVNKPEGVPAELADIIIRVLDMAEHYGIDMEAALKEKHEFNKSRPYKHGGKVL